MKLTLTVLTLLLSGLALCVYPPPTKDSEWLTGKDKEKEGIDVPEPGGNWRSRPQCMTSRPYYVGYGRWREAMEEAQCLSTKLDEAWIIGPHKIDTMLCRYDTNIFLLNDNDFNVTVPFPVLGSVAMDIVRDCSDHRKYVNGEEDLVVWGKRLTIIIAWRDCPGDPDW